MANVDSRSIAGLRHARVTSAIEVPMANSNLKSLAGCRLGFPCPAPGPQVKFRTPVGTVRLVTLSPPVDCRGRGRRSGARTGPSESPCRDGPGRTNSGGGRRGY